MISIMELSIETARSCSLDEYFAMERASDARHEYHGGRIVAMSGGTLAHGTIGVNVSGELRERLANRPCRSFAADTRVKVKRTGQYFYPDASALCGDVEIDSFGGLESICNPQLVVEVLSPSTENFDRNAKFDAYRLLDSLLEYVLIEQREPRVTVLSRSSAGEWRFESFVGLDATVKLLSVQIDVPMRDIYRNVEFPPPEKRAVSTE